MDYFRHLEDNPTWLQLVSGRSYRTKVDPGCRAVRVTRASAFSILRGAARRERLNSTTRSAR
jgi:hypothetical protein